jgi:hypothetical protein
MIDLSAETPISLAQAARLLPPGRNGRPVTLGCVLRWILRGAKAPDGHRVHLEAVRLGGRWLTSKEGLQRFAEALTPTLGGSTTASTPLVQPLAPSQIQR